MGDGPNACRPRSNFRTGRLSDDLHGEMEVLLLIDAYYWPTPNGWKISIALEEMELDYKVVPVNIMRGDQFSDDYLNISPNNRMPAIVDHDPADGGDPISVF